MLLGRLLPAETCFASRAYAHDPLPLRPRARDTFPMQLQVFRQYASRCAGATPCKDRFKEGFAILSADRRERS
jgi:hypothetical protein